MKESAAHGHSPGPAGAPFPHGPSGHGAFHSTATDKAASDREALEQRVKSLRISSGKRDEGGALVKAISWTGWALACAMTATAIMLGWAVYRDKPLGLTAGGSATAADAARPASGTVTAASIKPNGAAESAAPAANPDAPAQVASGYIIPIHQIQVSPKVSGMIVKLNFEEGMMVQKGFLLAELETIEYQAELDKARANLEDARQRLAELLAGARPEERFQSKLELDEMIKQREQSKLDYERTRRLTAIQSAGELEKAQFTYEGLDRRVERLKSVYELMVKGPREERIKSAEAQVKGMEAELTKAQWRFDNCRVTAPVTGIILTKKAEEGNMVNPAAFNVSANLCEMADLTQLEVDLSIQERDFARLSPRMECNIMPEVYRNSKPFLARNPKGYTGYISRVMPQADRGKGAIPVRVKIDVPPEEQGTFLKPDMKVEVTFFDRTRPTSPNQPAKTAAAMAPASHTSAPPTGASPALPPPAKKAETPLPRPDSSSREKNKGTKS